MEILIGILLMIVTLGLIGVCLIGAIIAESDNTVRKQQYRAGTHDYYGNKLSDQE